MVMLMFLGFGIGSAICGAVAAKMLGEFGWKSMFVIGGLVPIALVPLLILALPESPAFMALRGNQDLQIRSILRRINPVLSWGEDTRFVINEEIASGLTVRHLFNSKRALGTIMLWVMYSAGLFNLYFLMAWLPTIIHNLGISIELSALITANMQVAITISTLLVAFFADRIGVHRILPVLYFMAAVFVASIGIAGNSSISPIWITRHARGDCSVRCRFFCWRRSKFSECACGDVLSNFYSINGCQLESRYWSSCLNIRARYWRGPSVDVAGTGSNVLHNCDTNGLCEFCRFCHVSKV